MMGNSMTKKRILCLLIVLLTAVLLSGCTQNGDTISSLSQLKEPGRTIAVSDGTPEEVLVRKDFAGAKIQTYTDMVSAYIDVKTEKPTRAYIHAARWNWLSKTTSAA